MVPWCRLYVIRPKPLKSEHVASKYVRYVTLCNDYNVRTIASNLFKLVIIYGIPRMGRNFDDCPEFQKINLVRWIFYEDNFRSWYVVTGTF